jgi:hypothetical protein
MSQEQSNHEGGNEKKPSWTISDAEPGGSITRAEARAWARQALKQASENYPHEALAAFRLRLGMPPERGHA